MPRGDRTGPSGKGRRTGRGLGYCAGYDGPGFLRPGPGLGRGYGFGRGSGFGRGRGMGWRRGRGADRGWGRRYWQAPPPDVAEQIYDDPRNVERDFDYKDEIDGQMSPEEEKEDLERYLKELEAEIAGVKKRLDTTSTKK